MHRSNLCLFTHGSDFSVPSPTTSIRPSLPCLAKHESHRERTIPIRTFDSFLEVHEWPSLGSYLPSDPNDVVGRKRNRMKGFLWHPRVDVPPLDVRNGSNSDAFICSHPWTLRCLNARPNSTSRRIVPSPSTSFLPHPFLKLLCSPIASFFLRFLPRDTCLDPSDPFPSRFFGRRKGTRILVFL